MTAEEMRALKLHFQFIGTTWTEWEERQRRQNEPIEDVYLNKRAPVVVLQNGEHVVREDMLWGFPKHKPGANWGTNFRTLSQWRPWLDREHRCVVPARG
jgi:putative SOS response-associated peptidase YedK